jgi:hypothetical protein
MVAQFVADRAAQVCSVWETAASVEPLEALVACRSAIALEGVDTTPRFCFVSVASPIEQLLEAEPHVFDRAGGALSVAELAHRLIEGEVAAVLTSRRSVPKLVNVVLPDPLLVRRAELRRANVLARFLLRQIGLEEVSSHRGAHVQLYDEIAELWSTELSLFTDPAMLLTLGADRQRYVDQHYTERATDRLPRALGRLHDLGVRSYPRLVIV